MGHSWNQIEEKITLLSFDPKTRKEKQVPGVIVWDSEHKVGKIKDIDLVLDKKKKILGEGTFGLVIEGQNGTVIKCLKNSSSKRVYQECRQLWDAEFNRNNSVIGISGEKEGFIVMPNLGENLSKFRESKEAEKQSFSDITYSLKYFFGDLQFLHANRICRDGFIHRDIKPANVLIKPEVHQGRMRYPCSIVDFGLSTTESKISSNDGTPMYMGPEIRYGVHGKPNDMVGATAVAIEILGGKKTKFYREWAHNRGQNYRFQPFYHGDILSSQKDLSPFRQAWLRALIQGFLDQMQAGMRLNQKIPYDLRALRKFVKDGYDARPNADQAVEFFSDLHKLATLFENETTLNKDDFLAEAKELVNKLYKQAFKKEADFTLAWPEKPKDWEQACSEQILIANWVESGKTTRERQLRLSVSDAFQAYKQGKTIVWPENLRSPSVFPVFDALINKFYPHGIDTHYQALEFSCRLFDNQLPPFQSKIQDRIKVKKAEFEEKKATVCCGFFYPHLASFSSDHVINKIAALEQLEHLLKRVRNGDIPLNTRIEETCLFLKNKKVMKSLKSGNTRGLMQQELDFLEKFSKITPLAVHEFSGYACSLP